MSGCPLRRMLSIEGWVALVALVICSIGSVGTPWIANDVAVAGAHAYVADRSGFQVIDVTDPASPQTVGCANTPGVAQWVATAGSVVYVGDTEGLQVMPAQCGL